MRNVHFLNGKLVSEENLLISPRDLGYSRGYAVFDFLRTYPHHRPFMLSRHIDRLYQSAEAINLEIPWEKQQIIDWVFQTLNANQTDDEKAIRITISGGPSKTLLPPKTPTVIIIVDSVIDFPPELYNKGINVKLVNFQRHKAWAKTTNYIEAVGYIRQHRVANFDEIVFYSGDMVREGAVSNIFAVINGKLLTPKSDILPGVTRSVLLEILNLDIPISTEDFSLADLEKASEVFLSVSGKEIVPVTSIGNHPVGDGVVGTITKKAIEQFHKYTLSDLW